MRFFAIVGIAGVLAVENAVAATSPEPSTISQKAGTQYSTDGSAGTKVRMDGITYSATNGDGQWTGFTPYAKESKSDEFTLLNQKETETSIICRYESKDEGISLSLKK